MKHLMFVLFLHFSSLFVVHGQDKYLDKGNDLLNSRRYSKAEQLFREGIKSDSSNLIYRCQLGLALIQQEKYSEAEIVLNEVLSVDSSSIGALWYSGIGNFTNGQNRKAISRFEKVIGLLDKSSGQYYSANWFIGKCYSVLLKTEGLTYGETDRMFECYEEYLRLQPSASDAAQIKEYVALKRSRRPPSNVLIWKDL